MENRIEEDRVDPHLVEKLTTQAELEGLLVLAIGGLRRAPLCRLRSMVHTSQQTPSVLRRYLP
jgi:hypothetical protein